MKIAYDYNIFFTQKYGGISRYFCSIIKEIIKQKDEHQIKIFSPLFKNRYLSEIRTNCDQKSVRRLVWGIARRENWQHRQGCCDRCVRRVT